MEAPVIFLCRNNGWAISTPTSEQFRSTFLQTLIPMFFAFTISSRLRIASAHSPWIHEFIFDSHGGMGGCRFI